jgi:hypothetical protein
MAGRDEAGRDLARLRSVRGPWQRRALLVEREGESSATAFWWQGDGSGEVWRSEKSSGGFYSRGRAHRGRGAPGRGHVRFEREWAAAW